MAAGVSTAAAGVCQPKLLIATGARPSPAAAACPAAVGESTILASADLTTGESVAETVGACLFVEGGANTGPPPREPDGAGCNPGSCASGCTSIDDPAGCPAWRLPISSTASRGTWCGRGGLADTGRCSCSAAASPPLCGVLSEIGGGDGQDSDASEADRSRGSPPAAETSEAAARYSILPPRPSHAPFWAGSGVRTQSPSPHRIRGNPSSQGPRRWSRGPPGSSGDLRGAAGVV
jgi:hypothetical protein